MIIIKNIIIFIMIIIIVIIVIIIITIIIIIIVTVIINIIISSIIIISKDISITIPLAQLGFLMPKDYPCCPTLRARSLIEIPP